MRCLSIDSVAGYWSVVSLHWMYDCFSKNLYLRSGVTGGPMVNLLVNRERWKGLETETGERGKDVDFTQ